MVINDTSLRYIFKTGNSFKVFSNSDLQWETSIASFTVHRFLIMPKKYNIFAS